MDIGITLLHAGLWGRYEQDSFEYSVQNFVTVPQCKTDGQEGEEAARSSQPYSCPGLISPTELLEAHLFLLRQIKSSLGG